MLIMSLFTSLQIVKGHSQPAAVISKPPLERIKVDIETRDLEFTVETDHVEVQP